MKQKLFVPSKLFLLQWNSFFFCFFCVRRCSFTTHITALYCSQRSKQRQPQSGCLEIQPTFKGPVWFVPWEMRGWQICEVSGAFYHQVSAAANCSIKGLLTGSVLTTPSSADELLLQMLHDLQKLNKCNVCSSLFAIEEHRGTFFLTVFSPWNKNKLKTKAGFLLCADRQGQPGSLGVNAISHSVIWLKKLIYWPCRNWQKLRFPHPSTGAAAGAWCMCVRAREESVHVCARRLRATEGCMDFSCLAA